MQRKAIADENVQYTEFHRHAFQALQTAVKNPEVI
jgi:hypothetical protein